MKTSPLNHIVRLSRRLNAAADKEGKSSFSIVIDDFRTCADIGLKLCLFAGVLPLVGYLLGSLQFYPSGVSIGETFFFLMVAAAFGSAYLLFIGAGFLIASALWELDFLKSKTGKWIAIAAASAAFLFLHASGGPLRLLAIGIVGFTFAGWCLAALVRDLDKPKAQQLKLPIYRILWIGVLVCPLILASPFLTKMNENVVMPNVGLRSMGVTLKLSEDNYNILSSAARGQHLAALGCSTSSSGEPERLVHGVNLLWHGLGERSLVEIPDQSLGEQAKTANVTLEKKAGLKVELKRDGVFALHNYRGIVERCLELSGDVLFNAGTADLLTGKNDLTDMLKVISDNKENISEIQVIGHADALGYSGGAAENNKLAQKRADTVKKSIDAMVVSNKFAVVAEGHGAREPKTLCKDWPIKATLSECLAVNRRVEVRIKFGEKK